MLVQIYKISAILSDYILEFPNSLYSQFILIITLSGHICVFSLFLELGKLTTLHFNLQGNFYRFFLLGISHLT